MRDREDNLYMGMDYFDSPCSVDLWRIGEMGIVKFRVDDD
jgi:hypothetical protein